MNIIGNPKNVMELRENSYERLEYLGDRIIKLTISHYLFIRYPDEDEGFMTRLQTKIENKKSLSALAKEIGLEKFFIISRQIEAIGGRTSDKILEDCFEAFLGALFLDFNKMSIKDDDNWFEKLFVTGPGFQMAQIFVESIFEKHIDWMKLINDDDNYKNIIQVKIQKEFKCTPSYDIIVKPLLINLSIVEILLRNVFRILLCLNLIFK